MNTKDAINNLKMMSEAFDKAANHPKHYNSQFSYYLEQMSWEMHKQAQTLSLIENDVNDLLKEFV